MPRSALQQAAAGDLEILQQLNSGYIRAVQNSDVRWFEEHLSPDFLVTNPDCSLADRAAFLRQIARPCSVTALAAEDVRVRLLGDLAIIHARTTYRKPDAQAGTGRYTDVWVRREGRWLCVAAQVARG